MRATSMIGNRRGGAERAKRGEALIDGTTIRAARAKENHSIPVK